MKFPIFKIIAFMLFATFNLSAQSHYSGQYSLGINGGISDDGFYGNLNVQKLIGNNFFLGRIDANYASQDIDIKIVENGTVPYDIYSFGAAIGYSLEEVIPHPLYVQFYAGPFGGYEKFNNGDNTFMGASYEDPSGVIYGGYVGTEIELVLFKNVSLTVNASQHYKINSDIGNAWFQAGGGLKFNF